MCSICANDISTMTIRFCMNYIQKEILNTRERRIFWKFFLWGWHVTLQNWCNLGFKKRFQMITSLSTCFITIWATSKIVTFIRFLNIINKYAFLWFFMYILFKRGLKDLRLLYFLPTLHILLTM